ncbi:hypothetical protein KKC45_04155 [Patescibacteria group bacterium]|nr:hypothetical protein [Patescibacteria group bacterium]
MNDPNSQKLREYKKLFSTVTIYDNGIEMLSGNNSRFLKKEQIGEVNVNWSGVIIIKTLNKTKEMRITLPQEYINLGEPKVLSSFLSGLIGLEEFKNHISKTENELSEVRAKQNKEIEKTAENIKKYSAKYNLKIIFGIISVGIAVTAFDIKFTTIGILLTIGSTYYIWKKSNKSTIKKKFKFTGYAFVLFLVFFYTGVYLDSKPSITISEPTNNLSIQEQSVVVKGKVDPKNSIILINNISINIDDNGNFTKEIKLKNEDNKITITAKNPRSDKQDTVILSVNRIFTEEELAEIKRLEDEKMARIAKEKAEKEAEEKRIENEWLSSKAGKIHTQHPEWTKEDCIKLADGKIWIGMTFDMLKYKRGLPNVANPSNYGYGMNWQWCWYDYTPSCFYGDSYGIVESYN